MRIKWSAETVVSAIKGLQRKGVPLNSGYARKHHHALHSAAVRYFGSWRRAIEAAGIPYASVRLTTPRSKKSIIIEIRSLARKGRINTKNCRKLYMAAYKSFGGWKQAVEAAGFNYDQIRPGRSWSKTAIVDEVIRRSKEGLSIKGGDVGREDRSLYISARKYFGSDGWSKARVLAGFAPYDPLPWKIWDENSVIAAIRQLHAEGIALNASNMLKDPALRSVLGGGRKVFGTWEKALHASGLNYSKIRKGRMPGWWTKPRIIMCIKSLDRRGVSLNYNSLRQSHGALLATARVLFGSWSQAVETAGIPYRKHLRTWSTKAWLRRMHPEEYAMVLEDSRRHALRRRSKK